MFMNPFPPNLNCRRKPCSSQCILDGIWDESSQGQLTLQSGSEGGKTYILRREEH